MPGRHYVDRETVGIQDVQEAGVVIRPSILVDDPALGLYASWPAAHAAVSLLDVPMRTIWIDAPGITITIPPGVWDMDRIAIVGYPTAGGLTGQQTLTTSVGTTFTNFLQGTENCILDHLGVVPLFSPSVAVPNALRMRTGKNATWMSNGNAAVLVGFSGTGALFVDVEDGAQMVGDGALQFEVFGVAAGSTLRLFLYDQTTLSIDSVRGPGGSTLERFFSGVGSQVTTQANMGGVISDFGGSVGLQYTPGGPANWVDPDPTDVKAALDRLAVAVAGLLGAPIP